ncbi:sulfite exporter TauE/SafE family protein [Nocardia sp. NPDC019395]|uniref:sulfite exporter TauE/SafE family protein n=1 Tax=Nocardia sp. NPDC019395 TaxID=3154686 RepID=UPI00340A3ADA
MSFLALALVGLAVGVTTVLFGFGGGFVTVPVIAVADAALGGDALRVATATSALVMLVNAAVATLATRREVLRRLTGRWALFVLLAAGGAVGAGMARFAPAAIIRWGFVLYIGATIIDLLVRPGFFGRSHSGPSPAPAGSLGIGRSLGLPIGSIAAFLGVGGSVMTVPLMRRAGASMPVAASLSNPLTLVIIAPALAVSLLLRGSTPAAAGLVGSVDVVAALALLIGSIPTVVVLRRRPPHIPDGVHAWTYLGLLVAAGVTVGVTG